jgi:ferritin-like metal-binding protein YciE
MNTREKLVGWLQDAHAMERSVEQILERHIQDADGVADVQQRLENHLDDTRDHARRLEECLSQLGAAPSAPKEIAGGMIGAIQGMATGAMADPLLRNAVADFAVENFEIACYNALITTATEAGEDEIAAVCELILRDEMDMATWWEEQIPEITKLCLDFPGTMR